jgi:NAD-dependent histone deacetylase SIR2
MASTPSGEEDGLSPPRKKRKIADPKVRTTARLDLSLGEVKPDEQPQLDKLLKVLHKKRKIVVIAGAGISVSAGSMLSFHQDLCGPTLLNSSSS